MDENFYSVKEFSKKMSVHENTIRRCILKGTIQAVNLGSGKKKLYRIPKSEIERIALLNMEDVIEKIMEKRSKNQNDTNSFT